jgi:hypothetical protein
MFEKIEDITINYQENDILIVKELDKPEKCISIYP